MLDATGAPGPESAWERPDRPSGDRGAPLPVGKKSRLKRDTHTVILENEQGSIHLIT